jgi:hypothetical protein
MPIVTRVIESLSESTPLEGELDAPVGGTVTLTSATWTLFDTNQAPVGSLIDQACTGFDVGAVQFARAWITFRPATYSLTPGVYVLTFKLAGVGSDGLPRTREPSILLHVLPDSL